MDMIPLRCKNPSEMSPRQFPSVAKPLTSAVIGISSVFGGCLSVGIGVEFCVGDIIGVGIAVVGAASVPLALMAANPPPSAIWASISRPPVEQYCVFSPGDADRSRGLLAGTRVALVDMLVFVAVGW